MPESCSPPSGSSPSVLAGPGPPLYYPETILLIQCPKSETRMWDSGHASCHATMGTPGLTVLGYMVTLSSLWVLILSWGRAWALPSANLWPCSLYQVLHVRSRCSGQETPHMVIRLWGMPGLTAGASFYGVASDLASKVPQSSVCNLSWLPSQPWDLQSFISGSPSPGPPRAHSRYGLLWSLLLWVPGSPKSSLLVLNFTLGDLGPSLMT